jgi:hypothetical protein
MAPRWSAALLSFIAAGCAALPAGRPTPPVPPTNPRLLDLPAGRWIKIHQQAPGDAVTFVRQSHGGSAFDSRRGRLVLFGSDSHGMDWTNSPLIFDLATLQWQRPYADDDRASYRVSTAGLPVAGPDGTHPWAMHTFGAVTYDPAADRIVVASHPGHMESAAALAHLWPAVRRHPTWLFDPGTGDWTALAGEPVDFFPYSIDYDSTRNLVLGYRQDGVYELSLASQRWREVATPGLLSWGSNAVYDSHQQALVVFGSHEYGNEVVAYWPASGRHRVMPTQGLRPRGGCNVPFAYHAELGRSVALIDATTETGAPKSETWLYDLGRDQWQRVATADLPFGVGMNYNLEYDSIHRLLLLVAAPPGEATAVWALRLESAPWWAGVLSVLRNR